jgi:hypothetical protein
MRTRTVCLALALAAMVAAAASGAELDKKRYMGLDELRPGMAGVGRTTLAGTDIVEFQARVVAIMRNVGPKRDLIICRLSGAGLEESGVIAGMSGSPVYVDGRLIGAVGYSFRWAKAPLAGVQPIEQMLAVTDAHPWKAPQPVPVTAQAQAVAVPATDLAAADLALPAGQTAYDMQPILTPVMVSGLTSKSLVRLREDLAPFGLVPMQGGGAEPEAAGAKLEPGAPLAVGLVRGDIQMTTMGTITEIAGDRLYAFGHSMFSAGESNFPILTGVAKIVIPSLMNSFRMGAPAKEVGRLVWDEQTGVFCRLGDERAPMMPLRVRLAGPGEGRRSEFNMEVAEHRMLTPLLAATAAGDSLLACSDLPMDYTVRYRVRVKPAGREAIERENVTTSPTGDAHLVSQVRSMVGLLMDNPFQNLKVESVDVEATITPGNRMAEIEEARTLRNAVRPGETVTLEVKVRPWRQEPVWLTVPVEIPADYPEGAVKVTVCGGDDALRQEMREAPVRFQPQSVRDIIALLGKDNPRDLLYVRMDAPGSGLAIGTDELPNLPASMRTLLAGASRRKVTPVATARVTTQPSPYVLTGSYTAQVTVDRDAAP